MSSSSNTKPRPANLILAALPEADYGRVASHLTEVSLARGEVLHEPDTPPQGVYFLDEGVASLSVSTEEGNQMELSIVGQESTAGERAIFKEGLFIIRCEMITDGRAHRMPPGEFEKEFHRGGALYEMILARLEARITETSQTALCNQMHSVEQRLSRWLLTLADRMHSEKLEITHEHMANMLGVRRAGVTEALGSLRDEELVSTGRGHIVILDRAKLEGKVCECYEVIKNALAPPPHVT